MPELTLQHYVFLVGVGLFTLIAAISDFRTRRIPNKLNVTAFALGLIYQISFNGLDGLKDAGLAFAVGFGLFFVLWMIGGGGGGDVKLMGALSVWLGLTMTIWVMISSTVIVIAGTFLIVMGSLIVRGPYKTRSKYVAESEKSGKRVPESVEARKKRRVMAFAVPVALATWAIVIYKLPTLFQAADAIIPNV